MPPAVDRRTEDPPAGATVIIQLHAPTGEPTGPSLDVPLSSTPDQLTSLVNDLLQNEERLPYAFFLTETREELVSALANVLSTSATSTEQVVGITYQPQSLFRVRPVTRCTSSLPGHAEAILTTAFSPDAALLASGSGDTTVRLWKSDTQMPDKTLTGHSNWVLAVAFSPDGSRLASASMDTSVRIWDPLTGDALGKPLLGHKKWVTSLAWEPYHRSVVSSRLVSASKDSTLRVWNVSSFVSHKLLGGHTAAVTCVKWSGEGVIYSASQDRTIKAWNPVTGAPLRSISAHGHWVNTMALSTDYVLRCGAYRMFDDSESSRTPASGTPGSMLTQEDARRRYEQVKGKTGGIERLVSGSDDFTLMLWEDLWVPAAEKKSVTPKTRMAGHQQLVNEVCFSPDGIYIASASFDKSVRIWDGTSGKFLATLRGHVGAVYRVVWSADSRLLLSASKDSTCKVWDIHARKMKTDLPGHADEVYTADWSTDGKRVATGGKDRVLKLWHH